MGRTLALQILMCWCALMAICANGYTNYTVGDSLGWYDKLENPKVDYQKWAAGKNFSLGDFLIFNTDRNHSVIQTYNVTVYKSCDYADALDNGTYQWSASMPTDDTVPVSVGVALVREGPNYFFSSYYDGEQCMNGQRFNITVLHGKGLPEGLMPESPPPASDGNGSGTGDGSRFDFNHPTEAGGVEEEKGSPPSGAARELSAVGLLDFGLVIAWGLYVLCW